MSYNFHQTWKTDHQTCKNSHKKYLMIHKELIMAMAKRASIQYSNYSKKLADTIFLSEEKLLKTRRTLVESIGMSTL